MSIYLEMTASYEDGTTRKITAGPYDEDSPALADLIEDASAIKTLNADPSAIKHLLLSDEGADFLRISKAQIVTTEETLLYDRETYDPS